MSETETSLTEAEKQKRLHLVELLLPIYGKDTDALISAATSLQAQIEGVPHPLPCSTAGTE